MKIMDNLINLKLISDGIQIHATDGNGIIARASNTFRGGIDQDFTDYNRVVVMTEARPATSIRVYEINTPDKLSEIEEIEFNKMFGWVGVKPDLLCFTQPQIIQFVEKHRDWLRTAGYWTLFLFKFDGEIFVACVSVDNKGPWVGVSRYIYGSVWKGKCGDRIVVPTSIL